MSTPADDLAQRRFHELYRDVGQEAGHSRGWKTAMAKRLGLNPAHLSRLITGKQRVGHRTMGRAVVAYEISPLYFKSEHGSFRDFLIRAPVAPLAPPALDPEMAVMQALATLDPATRARVLRWAAVRFG